MPTTYKPGDTVPRDGQVGCTQATGTQDKVRAGTKFAPATTGVSTTAETAPGSTSADSAPRVVALRACRGVGYGGKSSSPAQGVSHADVVICPRRPLGRHGAACMLTPH
jgi:hypothetical protein